MKTVQCLTALGVLSHVRMETRSEDFSSETKQRQTANVENGGKTIITRLFLPFASVVRSSFRLCFLGLGSSLCCSFAFGISRIWWFVQSFVRPFPGLLVRFCIGLGFCRSFWVACGGRSFWGSCGGRSCWVSCGGRSAVRSFFRLFVLGLGCLLWQRAGKTLGSRLHSCSLGFCQLLHIFIMLLFPH